MGLKKGKRILSMSIFTVLLFSIGCASQNRSQVVQKNAAVEPTEAEKGSPSVSPNGSSEAVAPLAKRSIVSSVEFLPGRMALSPEATAEINKAIVEASQSGPVEEVNVVVWSDVEASAGQGQAISRSQVKLANERGQNIEKYIDRMMPLADVKIHNVAKEPSSFVNFIHEQDESVKTQLATMGVSTNEATDDVKGRSSAALVLIKVR